jgi:hypothetical protein
VRDATCFFSNSFAVLIGMVGTPKSRVPCGFGNGMIELKFLPEIAKAEW